MSDEREISQEGVTLKRAKLGIEVSEFLRSDMGKHLLDRAQEQMDGARLMLEECNPTDVAAITAYQRDIQVAKRVGQWLEDAVTDGLMAELQIRADEPLS